MLSGLFFFFLSVTPPFSLPVSPFSPIPFSLFFFLSLPGPSLQPISRPFSNSRSSPPPPSATATFASCGRRRWSNAKAPENRPGETLSPFSDKGRLESRTDFVEISAKRLRDCAKEMAEEITTADSNPRNYNRLLRPDNTNEEKGRSRLESSARIYRKGITLSPSAILRIAFSPSPPDTRRTLPHSRYFCKTLTLFLLFSSLFLIQKLVI